MTIRILVTVQLAQKNIMNFKTYPRILSHKEYAQYVLQKIEKDFIRY